jgi:hypothetical protein
MVITSDNNLIPYPGHHHQVQPYIHDHPTANQQSQQGPVETHKLFRRPHSKIRAQTRSFDCPDNLYDFKLFLQYPASDQVGIIVDIYA